MVCVYTSYRQDRDGGPNLVDRASFPHGVSRIGIQGERSRYSRSDEFECNDLANMIHKSPTKIPIIDIHRIQETSPEYLALLVAILTKADSLRFDGSLGGYAAYACFMGSMLQTNGLQELTLGGPRDEGRTVLISTYQAKLVFEGIAQCPSLKKFVLHAIFSAPAEVGTALASALRRNKSLEILDLDMHVEDGGTELRDLFQAAIINKRIHDFAMSKNYEGDQQLPFDVMAEVLCTDKCTVKRLGLDQIEPTARALSDASNKQIEILKNTSVTYYSVRCAHLDCFRIMETAGMFRSIKDLRLCDNLVSDLSPLDPLLVGENLTLETLTLLNNEISEKDAIVFFRKVPKMTCLRRVSLVGNPFIYNDSESWKDAIVEAAWQNRSLECIHCVHEDDEDDEFPELYVPLSLNRGGRRALEIDSSAPPLPANLWPHVLERAAKLSYFSGHDYVEDSPSLDSTRPDVVFWLLKEKILGSCLYG